MTPSAPIVPQTLKTPPTDLRSQQKVPVDEVVIRFTRQIFYADSYVFQAEVRKTPMLLRGGPFRADIEQQMDELRLTFTNRVRHEHSYRDGPDDIDPYAEQTAQELKELGCALYDLLPDPIRSGLPRLLQRAADHGHYLRLVLEARAGDQADRLLSMPWEIVFIEPLQNYLGLLPRVMLVRRLVDTVRSGPVTFQPPFNILHVIADAPESDYSPLDPALQQAEGTAIAQAVALGGSYHLVAQPGSVEAMQAALQAKRYQVVHFLGHGDIAPQTQQGYLIFAGPDGAPQFVTGEQLQRLLTITPEVQLVVLNACRGADPTMTDGGAIALKLVYSGIPYVIAMQDEILQKSAGVFAETFYRELQQGKSIDAAVLQARREVAIASPLVIDWSLPALYTNVGIAKEGPLARAGNQFERWLIGRAGIRQLARFNIVFGVTQLLVALLLGLSSAAPPLPSIEFVFNTTMLLLPVPPLVALVVWWQVRSLLSTRPVWSATAHGALLLRLFATASIILGLVVLYTWFGVSLLAGLGFWALLSSVAQLLLITLVLLPGVFIGWQMTTAYVSHFVTNAAIKGPVFEWSDFFVVVGGYFLLLIVLIAFVLGSPIIVPPLGNFIVGIMLIVIGLFLPKVRAE